MKVKLTAHQWWWEIRYSDPVASKGFVTANELHLPLGEPVRIALSFGRRDPQPVGAEQVAQA